MRDFNWLRDDLVGEDGKPLSIFEPLANWLKAAKKKDGPANNQRKKLKAKGTK